MFGKLNDSITNIFNKTISMNKMLPPEHNCTEKKCDGARFSSYNLICSVCSTIKYIECISDRTEIISLIKLFDIKPDIIVQQTLIGENQKKLNELFQSESLFVFTCPECKSSDLYTDLKKKCDDAKKKYNSYRRQNKIE